MTSHPLPILWNARPQNRLLAALFQRFYSLGSLVAEKSAFFSAVGNESTMSFIVPLFFVPPVTAPFLRLIAGPTSALPFKHWLVLPTGPGMPRGSCGNFWKSRSRVGFNTTHVFWYFKFDNIMNLRFVIIWANTEYFRNNSICWLSEGN